jgi:hypothetical protein
VGTSIVESVIYSPFWSVPAEYRPPIVQIYSIEVIDGVLSKGKATINSVGTIDIRLNSDDEFGIGTYRGFYATTLVWTTTAIIRDRDNFTSSQHSVPVISSNGIDDNAKASTVLSAAIVLLTLFAMM